MNIEGAIFVGLNVLTFTYVYHFTVPYSGTSNIANTNMVSEVKLAQEMWNKVERAEHMIKTQNSYDFMTRHKFKSFKIETTK